MSSWSCPLDSQMHLLLSKVLWTVFKPCQHKFVLVFFDDILMSSKTWETHLERVKMVLQVLKEN